MASSTASCTRRWPLAYSTVAAAAVASDRARPLASALRLRSMMTLKATVSTATAASAASSPSAVRRPRSVRKRLIRNR